MSAFKPQRPLQMIDYSKDHIDKCAIDTFNGRRKFDSRTRLQTHMPPAPFDGDPFKAKVILLLNNPTFGPNSSPKDHLLHFEGWPLAGLHPKAPCAFRDWYRRPFGFLIDKFDPQHVSQNVAIVQINPWASEEFDLNCELPSRQQQVDIVLQAVRRGAVAIIGRSVRFWQGQLGCGENIHIARNSRNPTLSPGGLAQEAFCDVISALSVIDRIAN